ncbi:S8 family peptidase [Alkalilimnicola sp. S0819]|uniref:S8 family peptidase n=1 Tax=Alkalilimnicola sp. S0819 TaxID=2613922 RepID=UPI001261FC5A|nr:S8 family peptidase [Alkalilimnicola sp. S0819]KAB7624126.1 S8 family serine peptidase [Alkalilimnicola sp. S0819]MPQ16378.1 S8 family serine peptidase [Alkalilimnicola sp. S0819]
MRLLHAIATRCARSIVWVSLLALGAPLLAQAASPLTAYKQTNQLIVKYRNGQASPFGLSQSELMRRAQEQAERLGVSLTHVRALGGYGQVLRLPSMRGLEDIQRLAQRMSLNPLVAYAEPDYLMQAQQMPNDPRYNEQWHYYEPTGGLNLPGAWDLSLGDGAVVAVVDTGVLPHADLAGQLLPGYDFISDADMANDGDGRDADASDAGDWLAAHECGWYSPSSDRPSSWHGTHVAGTIAAASNNGLGVAGVAWNARILPVRVLGKCGGYTSDIVDGMRWAAGLAVSDVPANPHPAQVINLSLGGKAACGQSYKDAIGDIRAVGTTVVVAAGNSNDDAADYSPANCPGVVTVAATNRDGGRASYSNYGSAVDVAAPGGQYAGGSVSGAILSTLNAGERDPAGDSYAFYQGTSMATPHVAGVLALMYAVRPDLTPELAAQVLTNTARAFPATGGADSCDTATCGAGLVDAAAAVAAAPTAVEEDDGNQPGFACTEHTASTRSHVNEGRAEICWSWYACAAGSGNYLGFLSSYGAVTVAETAPDHYERGYCN